KLLYSFRIRAMGWIKLAEKIESPPVNRRNQNRQGSLFPGPVNIPLQICLVSTEGIGIRAMKFFIIMAELHKQCISRLYLSQDFVKKSFVNETLSASSSQRIVV